MARRDIADPIRHRPALAGEPQTEKRVPTEVGGVESDRGPGRELLCYLEEDEEGGALGHARLDDDVDSEGGVAELDAGVGGGGDDEEGEEEEDEHGGRGARWREGRRGCP